jgi:quercetin dioxygenase-like cupin family protein
MKVITQNEIIGTDRRVECPQGSFTSIRFLLESDNMGFSMHKTLIPKGSASKWHYKHHKEACYCVSGKGWLTDVSTGEKHPIHEDVVYALDDHDEHLFQAVEDVVLISVFNPPVIASEVHREDGSYAAPWRSPVYDVISVPIESVKANDYNPNAVAPPEMELLETSIWEDGYTQPVVTFRDPEDGTYIVVDGFHRYLTLKNSERIYDRERGRLPVVVIDKELGERMASTIRHNRARGSHNIELMSTIVAELVEMGKGDRWICKHIGMSPDELLRLKQITGVAALFQNAEFSQSWDDVE